MLALASRRFIILAAALFILAACSQNNNAANTSVTSEDMSLGDPDARVTLVEYASTTCPHCRTFHEMVYPELRKRYIDTKKIRFVFRELPTPPENVAAASFQLARCGAASPEQYFERLSVLFAQQREIFEAVETGQQRSALVRIANAAGLTESQFQACLNDPAAIQRLERMAEAAKAHNVEGTPSLVLMVKGQPDQTLSNEELSAEALFKRLDAELAKK